MTIISVITWIFLHSEALMTKRSGGPDSDASRQATVAEHQSNKKGGGGGGGCSTCLTIIFHCNICVASCCALSFDQHSQVQHAHLLKSNDKSRLINDLILQRKNAIEIMLCSWIYLWSLAIYNLGRSYARLVIWIYDFVCNAKYVPCLSEE